MQLLTKLKSEKEKEKEYTVSLLTLINQSIVIFFLKKYPKEISILAVDSTPLLLEKKKDCS